MKPRKEIKNKMYITTPLFCDCPMGYIVYASNIYASCDTVPVKLAEDDY